MDNSQCVVPLDRCTGEALSTNNIGLMVMNMYV